MIGDGWTDDPSVRPGEPEELLRGVRSAAVVTGSRAEFGLLQPVMKAIEAHSGLDLLVIAAGSHLVSPALTFRDVRASFPVADSVPMQVAGKTSRADDVAALAHGVARFGRSFERLSPDWIVVLGDRIEAFAAAAAGSVGGYTVAHIHGGDRAEGIADEAMRHAISKLAHLHLAATEESAGRLRRMGERPEAVHIVGSPAIDGLAGVAPMGEQEFVELGSPDAVFLMHPVGRSVEREEQTAAAALEAILSWTGPEGRPARVLALHPNLDAGRAGILSAIEAASREQKDQMMVVPHLAREKFVGLLKRIAARRGVLVGNSSAALIECAALGVRAIDIGARQAGRERAGNVVSATGEQKEPIARAIAQAAGLEEFEGHPYGDGCAGMRIAAILAATNPHDPGLLRKRCTY